MTIKMMDLRLARLAVNTLSVGQIREQIDFWNRDNDASFKAGVIHGDEYVARKATYDDWIEWYEKGYVDGIHNQTSEWINRPGYLAGNQDAMFVRTEG